MPVCPSGSVRPVVREVVVFEAAVDSQLTRAVGGRSGFYTEVRSTEVARTSSFGNGFFELELAPGRYSLFVLENSQFMAVRYSHPDSVSLVTIESDSVTEVHIDITYRSSS